MPSILLTRPQADSEHLAHQIAKLGYDGAIEPLLSILPVVTPRPDIANLQAVMLTSAHALDFLDRAQAETLFNYTCFCVGAHTAAAAELFGFQKTLTAAGDGSALANQMKQTLNPKAGAILHIAGRDTDSRGREELLQAGFAVRPWITYVAETSQALSATTLRLLHARQLDAVLLFSTRTAETLTHLIRHHNVETCCETMIALGISEAVRKALSPLPWRLTEAAPLPTEDAMLERLQKLLPITEVP
jgi:uroporphyrinogen-III synthase